MLVEKWSNHIDRTVYGTKTRKAAKAYVNQLAEKGSPIIFDIEHLARLVGIDFEVLYRITRKPEAFYYHFKIPKRKGGEREISAPYPVLYELQTWIYQKLLSDVKFNSSATGFIKGRSIVDHAKLHVNGVHLLKMDLHNFFGTVEKIRVISIFKRMGYQNSLAYNLASICCLNGSLPQGAPTSPVLSNIVARRLDIRLGAMADKFGLSYSRYADDMAFSGTDCPAKIIEYVTKIVEDEGFSVNKKKSQLIRGNRRKILTGISISSGKLTLPKATKREIRKNVHHVLNRGLLEHLQTIGKYDPIYIERLIGKLNFWKQVEPENSFVLQSIASLSDYSNTLGKKE